MDLHIDEIEFTNEDFRKIYYGIIESFNENKKINIESFINKLSDQQQLEVTNIIMDNEKYVLHNWGKNNIYPKGKINAISQLTIETILNLRCNLIDKKVNEQIKFFQKNKIYIVSKNYLIGILFLELL